MTKRLQVYHTDELVVTFDPNVCQHSAVCLRTLPAVFDVGQQRWIRLENGSTDGIIEAVSRCPSGALQSVRAGQAPRRAEATSGMVTVVVNKDGPNTIRGAITVIKENGDQVTKDPKCSLCRCGGTKNAPFCDGTHNRIGFKSPS